jgi:hypothetical protein
LLGWKELSSSFSHQLILFVHWDSFCSGLWFDPRDEFQILTEVFWSRIWAWSWNSRT